MLMRRFCFVHLPLLLVLLTVTLGVGIVMMYAAAVLWPVLRMIFDLLSETS